MADHLRTELVLDALDMAIAQRQPAAGLIHHPAHGCQYTRLAFGRRLQQAGLVASMGTVGDALDNAVAESFFATLDCELLDCDDWPTRQACGPPCSTSVHESGATPTPSLPFVWSRSLKRREHRSK
jgi:putative transposase